MKSLRLQGSGRLLTILLVIAAWTVATNHCVFGLMKDPASHCAGCKPLKGSVMECCKAIHAVAPAGKTEVTAAGGDPFFTPPAWSLEAPARKVSTVVRRADFGRSPPGVSTAELVRRRSLLSHAPPLV